jgi:hypothetical protein
VRSSVSLRRAELSSPWIISLLAFLAYPLAASIIFQLVTIRCWRPADRPAELHRSGRRLLGLLKNTLLCLLALPLG